MQWMCNESIRLSLCTTGRCMEEWRYSSRILTFVSESSLKFPSIRSPWRHCQPEKVILRTSHSKIWTPFGDGWSVLPSDRLASKERASGVVLLMPGWALYKLVEYIVSVKNRTVFPWWFRPQCSFYHEHATPDPMWRIFGDNFRDVKIRKSVTALKQFVWKLRKTCI